MTASMLFPITPEKPKFSAVFSGCSGSEDPESAPAPKGEKFERFNQSAILETSRATACACFANSCPKETG